MTISQSAPQSQTTPAQTENQVLIPDLFEAAPTRGFFPSANLLPDAIRNRREVAHARRRALMIVVSVLGLLVLITLFTMMQQKSADAARDDAQARLDVAIAQKQRYSYVPAVYLAVSTARKEMAAALGQEIQVSRLLNGLSSLQPTGVSLQTWDVKVAAAENSNLPTNQSVTTGVGTVAISGEARSMEDIAVWLERVKQSPDYTSPVLSAVGKSAEGVHTFEATAELTEQALSGRYVQEEE